MNGWLLALVLWLAFNASLLLFGWLSYRRDEAGLRRVQPFRGMGSGAVPVVS
jgi:hypothetical protein